MEFAFLEMATNTKVINKYCSIVDSTNSNFPHHIVINLSLGLYSCN